MLQTNGLDVALIYSSTTDNGGNVLNASRELLPEATTDLIRLFDEEEYEMTNGDPELEQDMIMALEQGCDNDQELCSQNITSR